MVLNRSHDVVTVLPHVLDIRLRQWVECLQILHECNLPDNHSVDHTVEGHGGEDGKDNALRHAIVSVDTDDVIQTSYRRLARQSSHGESRTRLSRFHGHA